MEENKDQQREMTLEEFLDIMEIDEREYSTFSYYEKLFGSYILTNTNKLEE